MESYNYTSRGVCRTKNSFTCSQSIGDEHIGHRILFGVFKKHQRFQDMESVVSGLSILSLEELQESAQPEVAARKHTGPQSPAFVPRLAMALIFMHDDIPRIGDGNLEELCRGKQYGVWVSEETYFRFLDDGVECVRLLRNQGKAKESVDLWQQ